jgi:hypothetical protein
MAVKVDGSGEYLEFEGAFRRDGEDASDGRPSVLAADDQVHPGGNGEAWTGVACSRQ